MKNRCSPSFFLQKGWNNLALLNTLQETKIYIPVQSEGEVEFQERNLGLPVKEINQDTFINLVFGKDFEGHICIFQKESSGRTLNSYRKKHEREKMKYFLNKTYGKDTYISYSTYFRGKRHYPKEVLRTQSNIVNTHMLVQDADYYKYGMSDGDFLQNIGKKIKEGFLIPPTIIVSTGRGYQLIWAVEAFRNIAGYTADADWRRVQEHLYQLLRDVNSDTVVKSPSAVTRLPGTRHYLTKHKVYGFQVNQQHLTLKDFIFFHDLIPTPDRKVKPVKTQGTRVVRMTTSWNAYTLNRQREEDIFIYVSIQNQRKKSYVGIRNWLALVLRFHAIVASDGDKEYAEKRVLSLCNIMDMTDTSVEEILRRSQPAERFYEEWINNTWDKDKYSRGGLFYTNKRMLELMNIQEDYYVQWKMKTIKIKNNKYDAARKRFERLEKGETKLTNEMLEKAIREVIKENPKLGAEKVANLVREKVGKCSKSKVLKVKEQMREK